MSMIDGVISVNLRCYPVGGKLVYADNPGQETIELSRGHKSVSLVGTYSPRVSSERGRRPSNLINKAYLELETTEEILDVKQ